MRIILLAIGIAAAVVALPLHAADKGLGQHALARGIAIFLVLCQARQRGGDRWRHAKIHVSDPRWQYVRWKLVPLVGASGPQRGNVEVGCSGSYHVLALRCRAHFHRAAPARGFSIRRCGNRQAT